MIKPYDNASKAMAIYKRSLIVVVSLAATLQCCWSPSVNAAYVQPASMVTSLPSPQDQQSDNAWASLRQHLALKDQYQRPEVTRWIHWFQKNPKLLTRALTNAKPYLYYILTQTQRRQMPAEFALLPMVESDFNPFAFSRTGAVGLWQMMPGTAMIYGLNITWWYDGRRDVITSTNRALDYLTSLHKDLGDWLLAAAAYNAGEQTIRKAAAARHLPRRGGRFWQLSLPKETQNYVPKLLAIAAIVADPKRYGIDLPYIPNRQYFSTVQVDFQLDIKEIANLSQTSNDEIRRLNPGMRQFATSPTQRSTLLLPYAKAGIFRASLARLAGHSHVSWQYHEVHAGQTLYSIARNYHTSMALLRQVNQLTTDRVTPHQGLLVPLYLHRKYQIAKAMATPQQAVSPQRINSIASSAVLAEHSTPTQQLDTVASQQPKTTQAQPITQVSSTTLSGHSQAAKPEQQPIHEQDDLKTILNKLSQSS